MSETRTISLTVEFDVSYLEDRSDMTEDELVRAILDASKEERGEFVAAAKVAAIHILNGEPLL